MPSLLFLDHAYHEITRSTVFLHDLLKTRYDVTVFPLDPDAPQKHPLRTLKGNFYDVVVCFQLCPARKELDDNISFSNGVFFPMYDADPSLYSVRWYEYRDFHIINFCKVLHEKLSSIGFCSHYVQYFPLPPEKISWGDEKSVFFWQRGQDITFSQVEKLIPPQAVRHIHLHEAVDPGQTLTPPSATWSDKVTRSNWYSEKAMLHEVMEKSALYMAPRMREGIGMGFLEAMAMGRCVLAPDEPTMNEYISDGVNGFLYSPDAQKPLHLERVREIQQNVVHFMRKGYQEWQKNKHHILRWMEEPVFIHKEKIDLFYSHYRHRVRLVGIPWGEVRRAGQSWEWTFPHPKMPFLSLERKGGVITFKLCGFTLFLAKKDFC